MSKEEWMQRLKMCADKAKGWLCCAFCILKKYLRLTWEWSAKTSKLAVEKAKAGGKIVRDYWDKASHSPMAEKASQKLHDGVDKAVHNRYMDKARGAMNRQVGKASDALMKRGFGVFGDLSHIIEYSDEEEVELMRSTRMFLYVLILFAVLSFLWMAFSRLDVVSSAIGEVTPSSSIQSVQHLEGGIVQEILIQAGDLVKKGDNLIILESTASGSSVTELASRLASLESDILRLEAEALSQRNKRRDPRYTKELIRDFPETVKQSFELFKARQIRHFNEMRSYEDKIRQREQDVREVKARLKNLAQRMRISEEQVAISEDLLKDQLTNRYNHLELLREVSVIQSSIEEDEAGLERAKAQLDEMRTLMEGVRAAYLEDVNAQLDDSRSQLAEAQERMRKLMDSLERTNLTSPVDGVIKEVFVKTAGGVVKPGETVIDIVPEGDQLIIEANLPIQDIGYVDLGQLATIRLNSADSSRFDAIDGEVIFIAGDTSQDDDDGLYYYKVHIKTEQSAFKGREEDDYELHPGMQVVANVVIGRRSTLQYVLSPFLESSYTSMMER